MGQHAKSNIGTHIGRLVSRAIFAAVVTSALLLTVTSATKEIAATRQNLSNTGYVLASAAAPAVLANDRAAAQNSLSSLSRLPNIQVVALLNKQGTTLASLGHKTFLDRDLVNSGDSDLSLLLKGSMVVSVDIIKGAEPIGRLAMLADVSDVRQSFALSLLTIALGSIFAAAIGVLVSKPLQRRIVGPVSELTRQIIDIRKSRDYQSRVKGDRDIGEVGLLIESFNALMGDVRQRDNSLKKLAYFDPLTGLPNRAAMLNHLDHRAAGAGGALAIFDLRRFRSLNEAFGQSTGDAILLTVAAMLRDAAGDNFLARTSSHEFAVAIANLDTREAVEAVIRDMRAQFATPVAIGRRGIRVDVDVGVMMFAEQHSDWNDGDLAMQAAALALQQARLRNMPSTVFFTEDMHVRVRTESELGQDLRQALTDGSLEVHYQCLMDLKTGVVTGFESLCRWCHPRQGYISPGVFIPVAEANGLIAELGRWVLNESCRQASQWYRQTGKRRVVSVNVSAAQFLEAGFTEEVEDCLKRHGLPPELLCLELTESVFVGASAAAIRESLYVLSSRGVKLALDDFGTGYSSLSYLARLPFTTIKIDRAFVANAEANPRRKALLRAIVDMSHSVGMDVVAEGAETREELAVLRELGAEKVQGYVVARPLPAAEAFVASQAIENNVHVQEPLGRVA